MARESIFPIAIARENTLESWSAATPEPVAMSAKRRDHSRMEAESLNTLRRGLAVAAISSSPTAPLAASCHRSSRSCPACSASPVICVNVTRKSSMRAACAGILLKKANAPLTAAMAPPIAAKEAVNCPASPCTESLVFRTSPLISLSAFWREAASPEKVNETSAMSGQVFESVVEAPGLRFFFLGDTAPLSSYALAYPCSMQVLQGLAQWHPEDVFFSPPRRSCQCEYHCSIQRGVRSFGESVASGCGMAEAACTDAWSAVREAVMVRSSAGLMFIANKAALRFTCEGAL